MPNERDLTHILFMKKWQSNQHVIDIDKKGKAFIEDKITPTFFQTDPKLIEEQDDDSPVHITDHEA